MSKKSWRRVNTALFMIAFFAPWIRSCGVNTLNGFQSTLVFGMATSQVLSDPGTPSEAQSGFLALIVFIGLICIWLYAVFNLLFSFGFGRHVLARWRVCLLIGGSLGMLASLALPRLSEMSIEDYLWGYWLTWLGLLSSVGIEYIDAQASTTNVPDG